MNSPSHQEKLAFIREKCIETNPEKDWEDNGYDMAGNYCTSKKEVTLADVLLAFAWMNKHILLNPGTNVAHLCIKVRDVAYRPNDGGVIWNLLKTLEDQAPETIDFIHDILK